jgi:L-idonate 5-dehydrogenase
MTMAKVLKLHGPRDLRYEELMLPDLGPHDVRVRTLLGAISAGTEGAWYFGTDPQLEPGFQPGRVGAAKFPRMIGYEKLAEVVAVGSEVTSLKVGQRVVGHYGHAEEFVLTEDRLIAVPDGITDEQAVAYSLATVALHGIRRSRLQIGDDVFVTGLGFVGMLTVMLSRFSGASRITATDPYQQRRDLAIKLGADDVLDPTVAGLSETIVQCYGPDLFDVAFETSASFEALHDCMTALHRNGRLCVLSQLKGDYPTHPLFGIEFHLQELELITADGRGPVNKLARWYFDAIKRGTLAGIEQLLTHRVAFSQIENGFELLEREPQNVVKIIVTYD